jgi:hypothetical protein
LRRDVEDERRCARTDITEGRESLHGVRLREEVAVDDVVLRDEPMEGMEERLGRIRG